MGCIESKIESPEVPGQKPQGVINGVRAVFTAENLEGCLEDVAGAREMCMSAIQDGECDCVSDHADAILGLAEKVVQPWSGSAPVTGHKEDPHQMIQSLEIKCTELEEGFAKYSALAKVGMDVMLPVLRGALETFPFANPAAAVFGAVFAMAAKAAQLSENCKRLLELLKQVDAQLARALDSLNRRKEKPPADVESALQDLVNTIIDGGKLMQEYSQRGFMMRFILSSGDERRFLALDQAIHRCMERTAFNVSLEVMCYQPDESSALRKAICGIMDMSEDNAAEATNKLAAEDPEKLRDLVKEHGKFSDQVLQAEMDCMSERVRIVEEHQRRQQQQLDAYGGRLAQLEKQYAWAAHLQGKRSALAPYLDAWWSSLLASKSSVPAGDFFRALIQWFENNSLIHLLQQYEEDLHTKLEEACLPAKEALEAASMKICVEKDGRVFYFLSIVVLPLLDANDDGWVAYDELRGLQVTAEDFTSSHGSKPPSTLKELLDVVYQQSDVVSIVQKAHFANSPDTAFVSQALKVAPMLQAYNIHLLLKSYVQGTREWLFDRVNKWLEVALSAGQDAGPSSSVSPSTSSLSHHRMFMLLAGPGMGKSVFSAVLEKKLAARMQAGRKLVQVRHFFKVGQKRAEGKAMVLCLAMQLAEQLPGYSKCLRPVAEEHGCAEQLTLVDTFNKFLLEPLMALDKEHGVEQPVVVMLLDAIDEATDGTAGCDPVAHLVGSQMTHLPAWVKIILTGRPEMEPHFKAWNPEWIQPADRENKEDMRVLLAARLGDFVERVDFSAAVGVMLRKSEGQFIWAKFGFDQLCSKEGYWTPVEMEAALPFGLNGMFQHIIGVLRGALRKEDPDMLDLLDDRLLPILMAARLPMTPQQLAFATDAEQQQVDSLLSLLVSVFPVRLHNGALKVIPYHKSVLDWLNTNPRYSAETGPGHEGLGKACYAAVMLACAPSSELAVASIGNPGSISSGHSSGGLLEYALRFGVHHLWLARSCMEFLEGFILDFCGLWPMAFSKGVGNEVLKDMIALGKSHPVKSTVVEDVVRWQRLSSSFLSIHPRAAFQLALDSPHDSIVAAHANSLPVQPHAKLLTKDHDWSACLSTLSGHSQKVTSVAMSADTVVSGSLDKTIRIWDLDSGICKHTHIHTGLVHCVAITSDAHICVFGSDDHTLRVLNLEAQDCQRTLYGHRGTVTSVAISPDSRCVSGSMDKTLRVWDLRSGRCKKVLSHTGGVTSVAISASAQVCISGSDDKTIRIWNLDETVEDGRAHMGTLKGHVASVYCVDVSPDASLCVSGSADGSLRFWDLKSGHCKAILHHALRAFLYQVSGVRMSPDARFCVTSSWDKLVRVWDLVEAEKGQKEAACKAIFCDHSDYVSSVAMSSDARSCISGASDHTLRIWNLDGIGTRKEPKGSGHTGRVNKVALSLDARTCVSCSDDYTLRVWDLQSGACKHVLSGHGAEVWSVAISSGAHGGAYTCVSASADKTLRVWDLGSSARVGDLGSPTCLTSKHILKGHTDHVWHVAISTNGKLCVSGSRDTTLRVWDLATGDSLHIFSAHTGSISCMAISSDNGLCVSASADRTLRVWELASGACQKILPQNGFVNRVCISPDSRLCVAASSRQVREYDLSRSTGELDCCEVDSAGGRRLLALADSWAERRGCGPRGNVAVWASNDKQVIHWKSASAGKSGWQLMLAAQRGSSSMADPVAFLIPPMRVKFGPFYEEGSRKVRFFDDASNQLVCYQLLTL